MRRLLIFTLVAAGLVLPTQATASVRWPASFASPAW